MTEITDELRAVVSKDDEPWGVITNNELNLMLKFIRDSIREHDKGKLPLSAGGEETIQIERCPNCTGDVEVRDCGYSSFNPGIAKCVSCMMGWDLDYVRDARDAGLTWNKLAKEISKKLKLLDRVKVSRKLFISRDFDAEQKDDDAMNLLKQVRIHIVQGGEFKELENA